MNKLFWIATIHCRRPKNAGFDVKNDVISGVLFHLKSFTRQLLSLETYDIGYNRGTNIQGEQMSGAKIMGEQMSVYHIN